MQFSDGLLLQFCDIHGFSGSRERWPFSEPERRRG